jgi:hypothetical protein
VEEEVEMHGALWLFYQFADGNHVALDRLREGLSTLFAHPRCRLRRAEYLGAAPFGH